MTETLTTIMKNAEVGYTPGEKSEAAPAAETPETPAMVPEVPTGALPEFEELYREFTQGTTNLSKVAALKKLEKKISEKMADMKPSANREFKTMQVNNPDKKQFAVNGCVFKPYTKSAEYMYPQDILDREAELKDDKAEARKDGTALKKEASFDIDKDTAFSVSVV